MELLRGEFRRLALNARKRTYSCRNVFELGAELGVEGLNTVLYGLVQLLEAFVDLSAILARSLLVEHDELVQVADAAVRIVAGLVNTVALVALDLTFGALVGQVLPHVLSRDLRKLACVTENRLHLAHDSVSVQIAGAHGRIRALIRACNRALMAFLADVSLILIHGDIIVAALVDALEGRALEHLRHHGVQISR